MPKIENKKTVAKPTEVKPVVREPAARSYAAKEAVNEAPRAAKVKVEAKRSEVEGVVVDLDILNSAYAEGMYGKPDFGALAARVSKGKAKVDIVAADVRWHRDNVELLFAIVGERRMYVVGRYGELGTKVVEQLLGAYSPYNGSKSVFAGTESEVRNAMQKDGITSYVWLTSDATLVGPNYYVVDGNGGLNYRDAPKIDAMLSPPVSNDSRLNSPSSVHRV